MEQQLKNIKKLFEDNNYQKVLGKAEKLYKDAIKNKEPYYKAIAGFYIGFANFKQSNFSEAKEYLSKAMIYFKKYKMFDKLAESREVVAILHQKAGLKDEAVKLLELNIEYYTKTGKISNAVASMVNIATVFNHSEDFDYAISKYKECLEMLKKYKNPKALAMTLHNLGEIYLHLKDFENAILYITEAVSVSQKNGLINIQARALDCRAGICFFKGELDKALEWELKTLKILKDDKDLSLKSNIQMNIVSINLELGKKEEALKALKDIYPTLQKLNNNEKWLKYYDRKGNIEVSLEDFKSAYYSKVEFEKITFEQYNIKKLKILEENRKKTDKLMAQLVDIQKEKDLIELQSKKELQDKELTYKTLQLVQKNKLILGVMESLKRFKYLNPHNLDVIKSITKELKMDKIFKDTWEEFDNWFSEMNTDFFVKLEKISPNLSNRHRQLASLIKLNLRSKDIAPLMNITVESVEKYRIRLRKKLGLARTENLSAFISKL